MEALADNHMRSVNVQITMKLRAMAALHAMGRPQNLRAIAGLNQREGRFPIIVFRKGHVIGRVPVLCEHAQLQVLH